ncbi:MAG: hypothetical protein KIS68_13345 [Bauldia sp.]|nr:hypothetical protein [Bauldia sp.]
MSSLNIVDRKRLPVEFPTQQHSAMFWEQLGRTVATFGFLEETLGKAIFALTGTREIAPEEIEVEFEKWVSTTLRKALSDPLGSLIDAYGKAVKSSKHAHIDNFDVLLGDLRRAAELRNVICHGSWRSPDETGKSIPLFVDKRDRVFSTKVDAAYLSQLRRGIVELICSVVDTVTITGFQFPGSKGPGIPIW